MNRWLSFQMIWLLVLAAGSSTARELYVSPTGNDANPGTKDAPFGTLAHAAAQLGPGDTCYLEKGVYREAMVLDHRSGKADQPIRICAAAGETVIITGTDPVDTPWTVYKGKILKTQIDKPITQLFADRQMMIEARWPNARFDQMLDPTTWAHAGKGSQYGEMVDPELAKTGVDFTGATAVLNIAHQFFSWTRPVLRHGAGSDRFTYNAEMGGLTKYSQEKHRKGKAWEDDRYYLTNTLAALDCAGEWFYDTDSKILYFWPPNDRNISDLLVEVKVRPLGMAFQNTDYIELDGLVFFGCTFVMQNSNHCRVENCNLFFPTYQRDITREDGQFYQSTDLIFGHPNADSDDSVVLSTLVRGNHNIIRHCELAYSSVGGLEVNGYDNLVENCIIHDTCWNGSLLFASLGLISAKEREGQTGNIARKNTVYNSGNAILHFSGGGKHLIEYNHVYDGGLLSLDTSLVYTQLPHIRGSIVRYNWVHGCRTSRVFKFKKEGILNGGLGIRGDDQTRGLTVHHNVVWDCGLKGIIVKGDDNLVYHNTVLNIGNPGVEGNYIELPVTPEPQKPWRFQYPLLEKQNQHSRCFNNAAHMIAGDFQGKTTLPENISFSNCTDKDPKLIDPAKLDFRPAPGSPLIDAGKAVPGLSDAFKGSAPDIGAYESGGQFWKAGADWTPTELAKQLNSH